MRRGRHSILSAVRNWQLKRKVKIELLEGVRKSRGPGRGLDIPLADRQDPERVPLFATTLEEILKDHPELQVLVSAKHLTLGYKQDFAGAVGAALSEQLRRDGYLAEAGSELPVEELPHAGAGDPRDLYTTQELRELFSADELKRLGFTAEEIHSLGK